MKGIYLGDGVYADFDGAYIWLRAQRGNVIHSIALELDNYDALITYASACGWKIRGEAEAYERGRRDERAASRWPA